MSGFFTSYYDDVKNLDFMEFLRYFPGDGLAEDADQVEFDALAARTDFPFAEEAANLGWTSPSDLPVPTHRILRSSVDETLERYAGITSADLTNTAGTLYLPEYDAWYTFTSDFGPGTFVCAGGQVNEATGRDGLPAGTLYLENQELFQLVRTSSDYEGFINETYYEKYQDIVDGYFDSRLEEVKDAGYVSWELSEFLGVLGTTKQDGKGVVAFQMKAAFSTDPPELAPDRIAGGAYVDSQLRVHGLDWQNVYLVTLDGEPMGIAFGDDIIYFIDEHWGKDVEPAELQAVIEASTREG